MLYINEDTSPLLISVTVDKEPYIKVLTDDNIINLTGQSGSGKSTYASEHFNNDNYLVVDTDDVLSDNRFNNSTGINKELGEYFRSKYEVLPNCGDDFDLIYTEIINYCKKYNKTIVIDTALVHCIKDISLLKGTLIVLRTSIDNCYKRTIERYKNNNNYTEEELNKCMEKKKAIYKWYKYTNEFLERIDKSMNKEDYLNKVNTFSLNRNSKKLFSEQIELFYNHKEPEYKKYNIGDKVILTKNNLIHGSKAKDKDLEIISEVGLIASEFYLDEFVNKKKPYVVELWDITEEIDLGKWINKYTGVTIYYKNNKGEELKREICSMNDIINSVKATEGVRDYIIFQNQEQRFLPNDYIDNGSDLAFIVEYDNNDELIKNDIFSINFNKSILKNILPRWFYKKYMSTRAFDNYETGREKAIIFGIPVSMFKGIIVSRTKEQDKEYLNKLKELFPKCYICNLDGIIIY